MAGRNVDARTRDMLISLAVILVPVVVVVAFFTTPADRSETVERVDIAAHLARAATESPYPVLRASAMGDGWIPVRVGWAKAGDTWLDHQTATSNWWLVGYLSPEEIYFGVQQRDGVAAGFIDRVTRSGSPVGEPITIGERTWRPYESEDGRTRSLVEETESLTSIVTADTDFAALEEFTSALVTS